VLVADGVPGCVAELEHERGGARPPRVPAEQIARTGGPEVERQRGESERRVQHVDGLELAPRRGANHVQPLARVPADVVRRPAEHLDVVFRQLMRSSMSAVGIE